MWCRDYKYPWILAFLLETIPFYFLTGISGCLYADEQELVDQVKQNKNKKTQSIC